MPGTVEAVVWNPAMFANPDAYPKSLALLYDAIGYDNWVRYPDVPVSDRFAGTARTGARRRDAPPRRRSPEGRPGPPRRVPHQSANTRAPVLQRVPHSRPPASKDERPRQARGVRRPFGVRVAAPSSFSESSSSSASASARTIALLYGLVALLPYSVGVVASCSNYSLAIGIGQFLAACLVAGVLSESRSHVGWAWRRSSSLASASPESASGTTSSSSPFRPPSS